MDLANVLEKMKGHTSSYTWSKRLETVCGFAPPYRNK